MKIREESLPRSAEGDLRIAGIRCENRLNPVGIDVASPALGWMIESDRRGVRQGAYRIRVAGSRELLEAGEADIWDSGRVASKESIHIAYGGAELSAGERCWWCVKIWDQYGNESAWSESGFWEMGLLEPSDWEGCWLNDGRPVPECDKDHYLEMPAPLFRRSFTIERPVRRARLYIAAAGYYEASLNGTKVGDLSLDPGWTRYEKRVLYSTFDVSGTLIQGDNGIGVALGNGWYNPLPLKLWGGRNLRDALPTGRPAFIAQLNIAFEDGTEKRISSGTDWTWAEGPLLRNNIYLGEVYDARREIEGWNSAGPPEGEWMPASQAPEPGGKLQAQFQPPIRSFALLRPVEITDVSPGVCIFDMGQNFAGGIRISLDLPRGTEIVLRYGELLYPDGSLNPMTSVCGQIKRLRDDGSPMGGDGAPEIAWQEDRYIAKGEPGECFSTTFTWHAFRYVELSGFTERPILDAIEGIRQHSDLQSAGSFVCSNDLFNKIQRISEWTFLSNVFSVQSDCPHRERLGYGGDLVVTSDAFICNYDMSGFYTKSVRDWGDSALEDGMLTDTAPFVGIHYCGIGWAMAHPLLLLQLYQYYGEKRLILEQYATARRWFLRLNDVFPEHLVDKGLSDHEALESGAPQEMVTPLYYQTARIMTQLARIIGRDDDAAEYMTLADSIRTAYRDYIRDEKGGNPGPQGARAFALFSGMLDDAEQEDSLDALLSDIKEKHDGALTTGIFGTKYMLDILSRNGHPDAAYDLVNRREFPGWGYMIDNGATTLWEHWKFSDNTFSHNHPMFGSVSEWFYKHVAGIEVDSTACGADTVTLYPKMTSILEWAYAGYRSVHGEVKSGWYHDEKSLCMEITLPVGITAALYLPVADGAKVLEGGADPSDSAGVMFLRSENGSNVYRLESGGYSFSVS